MMHSKKINLKRTCGSKFSVGGASIWLACFAYVSFPKCRRNQFSGLALLSMLTWGRFNFGTVGDWINT